MSWRSEDDCPTNRSSLISFHVGLHVKGDEQIWATICANVCHRILCVFMHVPWTPVNVDGNMAILPNSFGLTLPSLTIASRKWMYCSERNSV
ncbi:hypothetical protein TNCV_2220491 [Trichonephila clavipes]|nr:hypothetical protein TNCV_2220491 [Trichonephila clavipes]